VRSTPGAALVHGTAAAVLGRGGGTLPPGGSRLARTSLGGGGGSSRVAGSRSAQSSARGGSRVGQPPELDVVNGGTLDDRDDNGCGDIDEGDEGGAAASDYVARPKRRTGTAWDDVNSIAAHAIAHLTAPMRFEGPHNVDLNEVTSTLVPFPRLHFLTSGLAPLFLSRAAAEDPTGGGSRRIDELFSAATSRPNQLVARADPRRSVQLACGFLLRGRERDVTIADAQRNLERMRRELRLVRWNPEGMWGAAVRNRGCSRRSSMLA
jgi:hypothetical protein